MTDTKIKLFENFRALFYAPYYAAFEIGAYERENVTVEFATMDAPGDGLAAIEAGAEAITWGGPMRVLLDHEKNPDSELVSFCEVVGKDPFLVIGREPKPDFKPSDLVDIRFASFLEAPTPWMCLQEDLRRAGIDPGSLDRIGDRGIAENMRAFNAGEIDAIQILEPFAQILLESGQGHIWYQQAKRGPCSYTTFYGKRELLDKFPGELRAMTAAMVHTLEWIYEVMPEEVVETISPFFPDQDKAQLAAAIARYKSVELWNKKPTLDVTGFERLRTSLLSGDFIGREVPYNEMVDTRFD
ncbi:MAG: ABC transporter substrate-binding protein [Rhodospirillales bacterium]|jgi:NitT/TauT family transport system substrate-binding protein